MERYVLQAMCEMGNTQDAVDRMLKRYKPMVDSPLSTLRELFDLHVGSYNHAWSGGPLIIMSQYVAGISPVKPAFKEFEVKPELGNLKYVKTVVPTVYGSIKLNVNKENGYNVDITVPQGTKAQVLLPRDYSKYSVDGHNKKLSLNADGTRYVLKLSAGKHTVKSVAL